MKFTNEYRSYANWARKEIVKFIKEHPGESPTDLLEIFVGNMNRYSCMNPKTSMIFSIAHDIALDILDELLTK